MQIERLSIKVITVSIFLMISIAAIILSMLAGSYFRQSALDAQMNSLSRVLEVATEQTLKDLRRDTFNLGMSFAQNIKLVHELKNIHLTDKNQLTTLLDDPFINGFVGLSKISLEKIRLYNLDLELILESTRGISNLDKQLPTFLKKQLATRHGIERLQSIDSLWLSPAGPLHSTIVPIGGLKLQGYLEIVIDPSVNLPGIGSITKTPINIFSADGQIIREDTSANVEQHLPVHFPILTSDGELAFRIVGYENVEVLIDDMKSTQITTTFYFLILILFVLLFALWLFHHYLFKPAEQLVINMKKMAKGKLDMDINKKGLREFNMLATTFNEMCNQIKSKTQELTVSQNRLLRLLDLDENAIMYFGNDNEVIYANKGACNLFGYQSDEMCNLYLFDLFADDVEQSLLNYIPIDISVHREFQIKLQCIKKNGDVHPCEAVICSLSTVKESGYAIALNGTNQIIENDAKDAKENIINLTGQRMEAVEQSLNSLLEIAKNNPVLLGVQTPSIDLQDKDEPEEKTELREYTLKVMHAALTCWEQDLAKNKIQLAEESRIWPVYMDKSTPTTRTLDKYLHVDSCPKNPRYQRVIDTADFVLKQVEDMNSAHRIKLDEALKYFRLIITGQEKD